MIIKDKKKINFTDRFKAKFGRYYKIIKPFLRVLLGTTLEGKDTAFIIESTKRNPRNFFKAQVYSLPDFVHRIDSASIAELQKNELRELLETLPLLLHNIAITRERWCIGKIKNHPFDIFIAPEYLVKIDGKNVDIRKGLYIQTKQLYQYPPKHMKFNEWISLFQSIIEEKITLVDFGFNGHIHFYNRIIFDRPINIKKLKKLLKKLYVPYNKHIDSMSVSFVLVNPKNETTVMTWVFYPSFYGMFSVFDLDFERAEKIYPEENWEKVSFKW